MSVDPGSHLRCRTVAMTVARHPAVRAAVRAAPLLVTPADAGEGDGRPERSTRPGPAHRARQFTD
jgi:hypothetical protein